VGCEYLSRRMKNGKSGAKLHPCGASARRFRISGHSSSVEMQICWDHETDVVRECLAFGRVMTLVLNCAKCGAEVASAIACKDDGEREVPSTQYRVPSGTTA